MVLQLDELNLVKELDHLVRERLRLSFDFFGLLGS